MDICPGAPEFLVTPLGEMSSRCSNCGEATGALWRLMSSSARKWLQLPTSADNVTLLALAAACPQAAAVDRYVVPAGPTAANPPRRHAAVDRVHRPTDL